MVRILLIEDDSTIAAGLAYSLEQEGWSVTCKGTLAQGRNALETGEYQLLLVDVGLPDGSGYDLCAAAKSRNIPVIFATARGDEGSVVLGLDMGLTIISLNPFGCGKWPAASGPYYAERPESGSSWFGWGNWR